MWRSDGPLNVTYIKLAMYYDHSESVNWKIGYWKGFIAAIYLVYPTSVDMDNMTKEVATNILGCMADLRKFLDENHIDYFEEFYTKTNIVLQIVLAAD